jgi:hypothetical protein
MSFRILNTINRNPAQAIYNATWLRATSLDPNLQDVQNEVTNQVLVWDAALNIWTFQPDDSKNSLLYEYVVNNVNTQPYEYATIEEAVEAFSLSDEENGTIYIKAGNYTENEITYTADKNIWFTGDANTMVSWQGKLNLNANVNIQFDNITFSDTTNVSDNLPITLGIDNDNKISFNNCTFSKNTGQALVFDGYKCNVILNTCSILISNTYDNQGIYFDYFLFGNNRFQLLDSFNCILFVDNNPTISGLATDVFSMLTVIDPSQDSTDTNAGTYKFFNSEATMSADFSSVPGFDIFKIDSRQGDVQFTSCTFEANGQVCIEVINNIGYVTGDLRKPHVDIQGCHFDLTASGDPRSAGVLSTGTNSYLNISQCVFVPYFDFTNFTTRAIRANTEGGLNATGNTNMYISNCSIETFGTEEPLIDLIAVDEPSNSTSLNTYVTNCSFSSSRTIFRVQGATNIASTIKSTLFVSNSTFYTAAYPWALPENKPDAYINSEVNYANIIVRSVNSRPPDVYAKYNTGTNLVWFDKVNTDNLVKPIDATRLVLPPITFSQSTYTELPFYPFVVAQFTAINQTFTLSSGAPNGGERRILVIGNFTGCVIADPERNFVYDAGTLALPATNIAVSDGDQLFLVAGVAGLAPVWFVKTW